MTEESEQKAEEYEEDDTIDEGWEWRIFHST